MDQDQFDAIARSAAASAPRRTALQLLTGASLGAVAGWLGREVAAGCGQVGKRCETNRDCCDRRCKRRACRCPAGREKCGARCCDPLQTCVGGECRFPGNQGTCATGADTCAKTAVCNGDASCRCYHHAGGGTVCGGPQTGGYASCGGCTSDADCQAYYPEWTSWFCVVDPTGNCGCDAGETYCIQDGCNERENSVRATEHGRRKRREA